MYENYNAMKMLNSNFNLFCLIFLSTSSIQTKYFILEKCFVKFFLNGISVLSTINYSV